MIESTEDVLALSSAVPKGPEESQAFRLAQLLLLLSVASDVNVTIATLDRLAAFDFLAANPFIAVSTGTANDDRDRLRLRLAGFSDQQLAYASTGQRFISRRERVQQDLALLIAFGLVAIRSGGYSLTTSGRENAERLQSLYAETYREGAAVVLRRLGRLSNLRLSKQMESWLGRSWLLIDLLDDVVDAQPTERSTRGRGSDG